MNTLSIDVNLHYPNHTRMQTLLIERHLQRILERQLMLHHILLTQTEEIVEIFVWRIECCNKKYVKLEQKRNAGFVLCLLLPFGMG